jgi:hypothetical protein
MVFFFGNQPYAAQLSFIHRYLFGIQDFCLGEPKGLRHRHLDSSWVRSLGTLSYFVERPTSKTIASALLSTSGGISLAPLTRLRLGAGWLRAGRPGWASATH